MIVVSDTSPISNLVAIGQLDLVRQLYNTVIIPSAVYQELLNAGDTNSATLAIKTLDWIQTQAVTNLALLQTVQSNLDVGEVERQQEEQSIETKVLLLTSIPGSQYSR